MKNFVSYKSHLIVLLLSFFGTISPVLAGGAGTGGGDADKSTPQQVEDAIYNLEGYSYGFIFDEYQLNLITPENISDTELRSAATRIFGEPEKIAQVNYPSKFTAAQFELGTRLNELFQGPNPNVNGLHSMLQPIAKGPCTGDEIEGDVDASTKHERGAPICFSIERLTRIPSIALQDQVTALFFHEIAHQYGYGESVARKIQHLVEKTLSLVPVAKAVKDLADALVAPGTYGKTPFFFCSKAGYIAGLIAKTPMRDPGFDTSLLSSQDAEVLKRHNGILNGNPKGVWRIPPSVLANAVVDGACPYSGNFDSDFLSVGLKMIRSDLDNQ